MKKIKRNTNNQTALLIIELLLIIAVFATLLSSFRNLDTDASREGVKQLETSVRRSVMACYASEGVYPPDVQYLRDNYGLQVDDSHYSIQYSIFAENLMPDITVIEIKS